MNDNIMKNNNKVKYVFGSLSFSEFWKLVHFETLDQFSPSSFEICRFSLFNQIC